MRRREEGQNIMRRIQLVVLAILVASCGTSPKQARKELIGMGYSYSRNSFVESVKQEDEKAVRLFLLAGMQANVKVSGYTILEHAVHSPQMVQILLAAGADPNAGGGVAKPLLEAAARGDSVSVRLLLEVGAAVGAGDGKGYTALMAAADRGRGEIVQILLAAGADVNTRSQQGHTALGEALAKGHREVADLLAAAGADEQLVGTTLKALLEPERLAEKAPARYEVAFETSAGGFAVAVERALAPRGADRFYNLVKHGYFDAQRFFRVVEGRLVQFGIHGTPEVAAQWYGASIADDVVAGQNKRGTLSFACGDGDHSRSTQIFINLADNANFDRMGLAPFGAVVGDGMRVVDAINAQYGETPEQGRLVKEGNEYLQKHFPVLDYIVTARLVGG